MAHDAQLVIINGQKRVMTGTFTAVKNDKGEWVRQVDAMSNPIYYFESGKLKARESPALRGPTLPSASGMTNTYVRGANGTPDKLVGGEGSIANAAGQCCDTRTTVFNFDGWDIIPSQLTQSFIPYLGTIDKYKNIVSLNGPGVPHVYRAYAKDLNNDGYDDLLLAQSLWSETSKDFPSALQVLLNNGRGTFSDATDLLNPDLPQATEELGYTPTFIDIDNSGIETILWNGSSSYSGVARLSDYVLLNDGTGRLYSALPDAFKNSGKAIKDFLRAQGLNYNDSVPPRFIAVPQPDGSLNFLAESGGIRLNANVNVSQLVYHYVNSGFRYDPRNDFTQTVSISDRRQSVRIRTWAGDDTISDKNAAKATTIDGGLGANKATYSGPSTAYSVVKNADGTSTVTTTVSGSYPSVKDTLKNIQTIQFTDKSVTLSARARLN